ncbi:MAG: Cyclic di-GMP binding protein YcgR [Candidatus Accumulibacter regalis]|jgi:c-di-GMP-binding flagellar brake protein YcgR|uniref:Flagellar brake protein YcgR n=1 Tax=Accumulibacter regalis TaxID=522306 RepID=A0A011PQ78_ACCRE|nr:MULTISPECIES: flagellar brake protein [unclassified Candidatus Accumulibacter]EXI89596.1 MAG: Cyclic di-GMP binding protein YcgR [Candidatus Accumulibacter regalis]MQM34326.1 flagellar brake protein [Candidatus Accumulibacter phosphatis]MBL8366384.1 flagellar brake protein [Accumulibacter sp.]MBN8512971.1 flagellar brake protein [Accumulibacter sp.]MBO3702806.1 flagellar brake protein [Accumulibacter sp.]
MENTDVEAKPEEENRGFEIEQAEEYSEYLLHSKAEIAAVLRSLIQRRALVSAYLDRGHEFLLTSLLEVDTGNDELVLDWGRDEGVNRQALQARQLIVSALVDKVKVQFTLNQLVETLSDGRPAFRAALPDKVLRLQRREYFRLSTPIAKPVKFVATIKRVDGSTLVAEASLLDISGGGVGLMATPSLAALLPSGMALNECKMTLPDEGLLVANLCVRNKFDVTTRGGARYVRVGCEFVALPGARTSMVQRYITRIERERKARLSGMA